MLNQHATGWPSFLAGLNVHCRTAAAAEPLSSGAFCDPRRSLIVCGRPFASTSTCRGPPRPSRSASPRRPCRAAAPASTPRVSRPPRSAGRRAPTSRSCQAESGWQAAKPRPPRGWGPRAAMTDDACRPCSERRQEREEADPRRPPRRSPARRALAASGRRAAPQVRQGEPPPSPALRVAAAGEQWRWSMVLRPPGPSPRAGTSLPQRPRRP